VDRREEMEAGERREVGIKINRPPQVKCPANPHPDTPYATPQIATRRARPSNAVLSPGSHKFAPETARAMFVAQMASDSRSSQSSTLQSSTLIGTLPS
jgi:hypothetical protein